MKEQVKNIAGIYMIKSPSENVYIGLSRNVSKRMKEHKRSVFKNNCDCSIVRSLRKYGFDSHEVKVLHELPADIDLSVLNEYEILYISQYRECGFVLLNERDGGGGKNLSESARKKISDKLRGVKHGKERILKSSQSRKGLLKSESTRKKLSIANAGHVVTEETRRKISDGNKGRKMEQWQKDLLSAVHKGRKHTEEFKAKRREFRHNDEAKKNIAEAARNRVITDSFRAKMREVSIIREQKKKQSLLNGEAGINNIGQAGNS